VFLVTTLSSGAAAVASQIATDPVSLPQLLAAKLPDASNTYLTYFVIQGLSSAPSNVLNYSDLLTFLFLDKFFDTTPRQKYTRYTSLKGMQWGKLFPKFVNFVIIGKSVRVRITARALTQSSNRILMHRAFSPRIRCDRPRHFLL
jgi:hypothetical protein